NWIEVRLSEVQTELEKSEETLKDFREKNRRIADSPELMLEQQRYMRDLEMNNALFIELKKQYEGIKIQEIRDMQVVQVLDHARVPVYKSGPNRKQIVIVAVLLGGFLSVAGVFIINFIQSSQRKN
ncbi:MAG: hypothetical protein OQK82_03830, partial [Candidatus Pacearchaeota archaeon]|nr:hypothetical protein [Candidatus Pacearchaeota archaeon]